MGGPGSGNRYHWWRSSKKDVVEDCLSLDANRWMREGLLKAGGSLFGTQRWTYRNGKGYSINYEVNTLDPDTPSVRLWYSWVRRSDQQQESANYTIRLTATRPRFGGLRWWFVCPLVVNERLCTRRVGKLYLPGAARYFGCRKCHDLTYTSCQESHKLDAFARFLARDMGRDVASLKEVIKGIGKRGRDL